MPVQSLDGRSRSRQGAGLTDKCLGPVRFQAQPVRGKIWARSEVFFGGFHAQTTPEHLQPGASSAPDRQRSERLASQLSVVFRPDRTRSHSDATPPEISRDAEVHAVRALRQVHRGGGLAGPPGSEWPGWQDGRGGRVQRAAAGLLYSGNPTRRRGVKNAIHPASRVWRAQYLLS